MSVRFHRSLLSHQFTPPSTGLFSKKYCLTSHLLPSIMGSALRRSAGPKSGRPPPPQPFDLRVISRRIRSLQRRLPPVVVFPCNYPCGLPQPPPPRRTTTLPPVAGLVVGSGTTTTDAAPRCIPITTRLAIKFAASGRRRRPMPSCSNACRFAGPYSTVVPPLRRRPSQHGCTPLAAPPSPGRYFRLSPSKQKKLAGSSFCGCRLQQIRISSAAIEAKKKPCW